MKVSRYAVLALSIALGFGASQTMAQDAGAAGQAAKDATKDTMKSAQDTSKDAMKSAQDTSKDAMKSTTKDTMKSDTSMKSESTMKSESKEGTAGASKHKQHKKHPKKAATETPATTPASGG
ncbi:hypothetical protein [Dyella subtropica]|uniref:hypothetical protein n=1 Tax=Dyella subtropica TaxID=2992127 RepID=UPI002257B8E4|nr:hypothetical protein [Dyella subtropica]